MAVAMAPWRAFVPCLPAAELAFTLTGRESYTSNVALWVAVRNRGPSASFLARIRNIDGMQDGYTTVDQAAWENTIEAVQETPRGGSGRLIVGIYSRTRPMFWFLGARSAIWAPDSHQSGWRFPISAGHRVTFTLDVADTTHDKTATYSATVDFADIMAAPQFELLES